MKKTVGVVSAFYPDVQELARNINSYFSVLDQLIIVENTPVDDSRIDQIFLLIDSQKVQIWKTGKNEGLAKPFNDVLQWAEENDYDLLLTMDQDSYFTNGHFEDYLDFVKNQQDTCIAIYSPARANNENNSDVIDVDSAISSGSIYPISVFHAVGRFREDYFIYMVDIEFCIRVKQKGYRIVSLNAIELNHQEGYAEKSKLGLTINNYSAQSSYYIVRNTLLTWKLYPQNYPCSIRIHFIWYKIIFRTLKIVLETNRISKLKALYLGLIHGIRGKSGEYKL